MKMEKSYEIIKKIKSSVNLVDIIGMHVQGMQKSGHNNYKCLCPFHTEKTPSFGIDGENQYYNCFGCGESGDVFTFVERFNNWSFPEAVNYLAKQAGISLPNKYTGVGKQHSSKEKSMIEANELLTDLFSHILLNTAQGKVALDYLLKRGFTKDVIQKFRIGYSLPDKEGVIKFLKSHNYDYALMEQANLIRKRDLSSDKYEAVFRNRIMFPIGDATGKTVGFSGRSLGTDLPKYLNSAKTPIFNKKTLLYNYAQAFNYAKREKALVIFEGFADVIAAARAGILNGVAIMGTALSAEHVTLIKKVAPEVILCFDGDKAGLEASYKAGEVLRSHSLTIKVALIPNQYDPDDYIKKVGKESFKRDIIAGAVSFMQFKMFYFRKNKNLANETEKIAYVEQVLAEIAKLDSEIEKSIYCQQIVKEFQILPETINNYLKHITKGEYYYSKSYIPNKPQRHFNSASFSKKAVLKPAYYNSEQALLLYMLVNPDFAQRMLTDYGPDFFNEKLHNDLFAEIIKYFERGGFPQVDTFYCYLSDQRLRAIILNGRGDLPLEQTEAAINDHLYQIIKKGKQDELKRKKSELNAALKAENRDLIHKLSTEILAIKLDTDKYKQNIGK